MNRVIRIFTLGVIVWLGTSSEAHARIKTLKFSTTDAFTVAPDGVLGQFEKLVGTAYGEVDPNDPHNAIVQDIGLAPRNADGMVEYQVDFYVLKPKDMAKGNGMLLYGVANRGAKGGIPFNIGVRSVNERGDTISGGNDPFDPGDGFLQKMGYTVVWSGWQPDVLPGNGRMTAVVPVARKPDGDPDTDPDCLKTDPKADPHCITGLVRTEISLPEGATAAVTTTNLSSGRFTLQQEASYEPVSFNNRTPLDDGFLPTLTKRSHVNDRREPIANDLWSFVQPCTPVVPGGQLRCQIRFPGGFQPGVLYELIYRAKNPTVLGLGWAAQRDLVSFFKYAAKDDAGTANPLLVDGTTPLAVVQGTSQSGRAIRTFLQLGFNADEQGRIVFEGAFPHIGGGRVAMNVRFGAPARGWGYSIDHLYPAYEFPFGYMPTHDPITGQTGGILDRCLATETCPRIFHVASALEMWEGRQSLGLTDTLGKRDLGEPGFIRFYIMASTEHSPLPFDAANGTGTPFGDCEQQRNPNPQTETLRALWVAFTAWVRDGVHPPPSAIPAVKDGTLVAPEDVTFPSIPANRYPNQSAAGPGVPTQRPQVARRDANGAPKLIANGLRPLDFGPGFDGADETGIITQEPPEEVGDAYGILVPQVDGDGNDLAGVRSVTLRVPLATYTGWNMGRPGRFEDGLCPLSGTYVPFAPTDADRVAGDQRPSIQARYGDHAGYVAAVGEAAASLVADRFLLPEDAKRLIADAEAGAVLK